MRGGEVALVRRGQHPLPGQEREDLPVAAHGLAVDGQGAPAVFLHLRRVDTFLPGSFPKTLREREARAARVREADEALGEVVAQIKKRGIRHPFVKNYVLARTTPLTRARKALPGFDQTFTKLLAAIQEFDVAKLRYEDVQRTALMAAPPAE